MKCYEKQSKQAHQRTFSPSRQPEAYPTTKLMRVVRAVQEPSPFPPTYPHPALRPALHTTKAQWAISDRVADRVRTLSRMVDSPSVEHCRNDPRYVPCSRRANDDVQVTSSILFATSTIISAFPP